jgi:hypothetical protein
VLFTSGYADASVMRNGLVKAGARFLSKPYRSGQLAARSSMPEASAACILTSRQLRRGFYL